MTQLAPELETIGRQLHVAYSARLRRRRRLRLATVATCGLLAFGGAAYASGVADDLGLDPTEVGDPERGFCRGRQRSVRAGAELAGRRSVDLHGRAQRGNWDRYRASGSRDHRGEPAVGRVIFHGRSLFLRVHLAAQSLTARCAPLADARLGAAAAVGSAARARQVRAALAAAGRPVSSSYERRPARLRDVDEDESSSALRPSRTGRRPARPLLANGEDERERVLELARVLQPAGRRRLVAGIADQLLGDSRASSSPGPRHRRPLLLLGQLVVGRGEVEVERLRGRAAGDRLRLVRERLELLVTSAERRLSRRSRPCRRARSTFPSASRNGVRRNGDQDRVGIGRVAAVLAELLDVVARLRATGPRDLRRRSLSPRR